MLTKVKAMGGAVAHSTAAKVAAFSSIVVSAVVGGMTLAGATGTDTLGGATSTISSSVVTELTTYILPGIAVLVGIGLAIRVLFKVLKRATGSV